MLRTVSSYCVFYCILLEGVEKKVGMRWNRRYRSVLDFDDEDDGV